MSELTIYGRIRQWTGQHLKLASYLREANLHPYLVVELAYESKTPHTRSLTENLRMGRDYAERIFGVRA